MSINIDAPRYDQNTYKGRAIHFLKLTNPLNLLASGESLAEARRVITEYKKTKRIPSGYNEDKLWDAKYLYDSAFHPDTNEKVLLIGRMSAQAPMNTLICGGMLTFYKTRSAVIFWQWINQTFNAIVNYSNRSGDSPISTTTLLASYVCACGGAVGTAVYLNGVVKNNPRINPVFARLVPFAAVAGANFINIPMMRNTEVTNGTPVFSAAEGGARMGVSSRCAAIGIVMVCCSRVLMAVPGMTIVPVITNTLVNRGSFNKYPYMVTPFQLTLLGFCVTIATPLCCAIFQQKASLPLSLVESDLKDSITKNYPGVERVYWNKGL